jgi:hypothetical protein
MVTPLTSAFGLFGVHRNGAGNPHLVGGASPAAPVLPDKLLDIYKDICSNIRVTDEISFKLLGIVPLTSGVGAGALVILEKSQLLAGYSGLAVAGLSAVGALITLGLFLWELWNIKKCIWFIARATIVEREMRGQTHPRLQFDGMVREEALGAATLDEVSLALLFAPPWGKPHAETLVYLAAIGAWLVPLGIAIHNAIDKLFFSPPIASHLHVQSLGNLLS